MLKNEGYVRDPWRCPYCGSRLIFDSKTHAYICPVCGIVFDYEMVPSYAQLQHSAPLELTQTTQKLEDEVVEKASIIFGEKIAKEIKKVGREKAEEVLRALELLVKKKRYKVSWEAIRAATEIANKYSLKIDLDVLREQEVLENIKRVVEKEKLPVTLEEIYNFALRFKNLWSGRKASTVAIIFTYIYVKKKLHHEIKVKPRLRNLIKLMEKIISEREPT